MKTRNIAIKFQQEKVVALVVFFFQNIWYLSRVGKL